MKRQEKHHLLSILHLRAAFLCVEAADCQLVEP